MMMAVRPDLVAADRIPLGKVEPDARIVTWPAAACIAGARSAARSASGVIGNPEAASAAKGERLFEAISDALATKLCNAELWQLPWRSEHGIRGEWPHGVGAGGSYDAVARRVAQRARDLKGDAVRLWTGAVRKLHGAGGWRAGVLLLARGRHGRRAAGHHDRGAGGAIHCSGRSSTSRRVSARYCLSGIMIGAKALLDRNPTPTRADIVAALEPHLCRCGTHRASSARRIQHAAATCAKEHQAMSDPAAFGRQQPPARPMDPIRARPHRPAFRRQGGDRPGHVTALAQIAAEELDVGLDRITRGVGRYRCARRGSDHAQPVDRGIRRIGAADRRGGAEPGAGPGWRNG